MSEENKEQLSFNSLALAPALLETINKLGYTTPSPIQSSTIPHMLAGKDVIGQAQTGTGKTAAFALPTLSRFGEEKAGDVQVLVLAPTRELALQVAESYETYGANLPQLRVQVLCGGMEYRPQIRALRQGVQIVVGTPGRVVDHLKRGTLKLDQLKCLVLDEADEMLRMGFIEDVTWVMEQASTECQVALFSATMPKPVRKLAQRFLKSPEEVTVQSKTATVAAIRQRYLFVHQRNKLQALLRVLETEEFDGVILFARTKDNTLELADFLQKAGFKAMALNGDLAQAQREQVVDQLKDKRIDILVATDVVARGLDVPRISMVLNYDIPFDGETYVHRIGRTGRAGREGDAILFVTPRERRMLSSIERVTRQKVEEMPLPNAERINEVRKARFKEKITSTLGNNLDEFYALIKEYQEETGADPLSIAAALGHIAQGGRSLFATDEEFNRPARGREDRGQRAEGGRRRERSERRGPSKPDAGMRRYRIEVGRSHGVKPANIVGAIANEANLSSNAIGRIDIFPQFSTVDLPEKMSSAAISHLQTVWVAGRQLDIRPDSGNSGGQRAGRSEGAPRGRGGRRNSAPSRRAS
ncbi:MAG TPA: DEAD/DEAH box helicase [Alcanivoracaceae bacterium]|nr:DEAD/DEAH box helicase [Alcanivoracaceae bacterium]